MIGISEEKINDFLKRHSWPEKYVREAFNYPEIIKQYMGSPYFLTEEDAINSVVVKIMWENGLLSE